MCDYDSDSSDEVDSIDPTIPIINILTIPRDIFFSIFLYMDRATNYLMLRASCRHFKNILDHHHTKKMFFKNPLMIMDLKPDHVDRYLLSHYYPDIEHNIQPSEGKRDKKAEKAKHLVATLHAKYDIMFERALSRDDFFHVRLIQLGYMWRLKMPPNFTAMVLRTAAHGSADMLTLMLYTYNRYKLGMNCFTTVSPSTLEMKAIRNALPLGGIVGAAPLPIRHLPPVRSDNFDQDDKEGNLEEARSAARAKRLGDAAEVLAGSRHKKLFEFFNYCNGCSTHIPTLLCIMYNQLTYSHLPKNIEAALTTSSQSYRIQQVPPVPSPSCDLCSHLTTRATVIDIIGLVATNESMASDQKAKFTHGLLRKYLAFDREVFRTIALTWKLKNNMDIGESMQAYWCSIIGENLLSDG
jgi:hypothetical protein